MGDMGDVEAFPVHEVPTVEADEVGVMKLPTACSSSSSSSPVVQKAGHGEKDCGVKGSASGEPPKVRCAALIRGEPHNAKHAHV